ncbi:MAG: hypothetical protein HY036_05420 [Nitrospirae bacterium]|nr:hypothetical protein [Nitrospirota bacterium]MBI3352001.1 hypothetical protein [Nitrospirota bacterium]
MKKAQPAAAAKKKSKTIDKPLAKKISAKQPPVLKAKDEDVKQLIQQIKGELLDKIDLKINALVHRLDRVENGIGEILDELRETEAMIENEPYEGQA